MASDYARRRRLIADELRDLAEQIEQRLPDKGAITELARKLDKRLDEMRPYRNPRARAKQAKLLETLLAERTGVKVALTYRAEKNARGVPRTYEVRWSNGPTGMKEHVAALARHVPDLDVAQLEYRRTGTMRAELAALLHHLDREPDDLDLYATTRANRFGGDKHNGLHGLATYVWFDTAYPERIDDQTARRIRAIYSLDPEDRVHGDKPSNQAWLRLGRQILTHGWPATREWLDQIAAGFDSPNVLRLDHPRTRPTLPHTPGL